MHVAPDLRGAQVRPAGKQPALLAEDTASVLTLASGISGISSALPTTQVALLCQSGPMDAETLIRRASWVGFKLEILEGC